MTAAELGERIRAARPVASEGLRERVRALAATEPAAPRAFLPRPALPRLRLLLPLAAGTGLVAVAAAGVVGLVHPQPAPREVLPALAQAQSDIGRAAPGRPAAPLAGAASTAAAPAPTPGRAQQYAAQLTIEVRDGDALSEATSRAQAAARDLGGYVVSVAYASAESGAASLTLRVPTARVQDALARLSALGKIVSQQVQIADLQQTLDRLDREILVRRERIAHVTALLAGPSLSAERRVQLTALRDRLQASLREIRRSRADIAEQASYATIQLELRTAAKAVAPPASRSDRTLDQAGRILVWEGVAALYALAVAGPLAALAALAWLAARTRRRAEERRLLARS